MSYSKLEPSLDRVVEGLLEHERERSASVPSPARYGDLELLGRGGMGIVYRARDLKLNRIVALKFLNSPHPEDAKRFMREAQLAAQLSHPHLVPIHEVGEIEGKPFIAMEFVDGKSLHELRLPLRRAVEVVRDAADAVHYAHDKGIVHRDLTPLNLMLDRNGHVWVMDFGLARVAERGTTITSQGVIIGTPAYMSPEQASGEHCDARSDVYSLGATLYQLLTGQAPFEGPNPVVILDRVRAREVAPLRRFNPAVPRDLQNVVLKALEKRPTNRYSTAKAFADDLRRFLDGASILARPIGVLRRLGRFVRRHKVWTTLLLAATVFAAGTGGVSSYRSAGREAAARRWLAEGDRAARDGRWSRALECYTETRRLDPDRTAAERGARIAQEMIRAREALVSRDRLLAELSSIRKPSLTSSTPASEKEQVWKLEARIDVLRREAAAREQESELSALTALAFDPGILEARTLLADLYLSRYERAVAGRNRAEAEWWQKKVLHYGGPEHRARFEVRVSLTLLTRPAGARAWLFRYEERNVRLHPLPCDSKGRTREVDLPRVDALPFDSPEEAKKSARDGSAYRLHTGEQNEVSFPLSLPPGSYLVLFEKAGFAQARFPVLLEPDRPVRAEIALLPGDAIPAGFVYVPEGATIAGSDPEAEGLEGPGERRPRTVGSFFLARFSVTAGEYLDFLNDRSAHTAAQARKRQPRLDNGGTFWNTEGEKFTLLYWNPDEPLVGISLEDAIAYARWYSQKRNNRWRFRLPTEEEWEKAARGADGRCFPWGDRFDFAFAASERSRPMEYLERKSVQERIGLFPADESPFGVRDMAGVIANWLNTRSEDFSVWAVKGGGWSSSSRYCRSASRATFPPRTASMHIGVRLAADLPTD